MHLKVIIGLLLVICLANVNSQTRDECMTVRRECESCSNRLGSTQDNRLQDLNRHCRHKLRRTWHWTHQYRCDIAQYRCLTSRMQKLNCETIARMAGMRRRRH